MKKLQLLIIAVILVCLSAEANAQRFSLFHSQTMSDAIENPTREYFYDTCKAWAVNFFPQFGIDMALMGDVNKLAIGSIYNERLTPFDIPNGKRTGNILLSQVNLNIFTLKILTNKSRQSELLINFGVKSQNRLMVKNEFFNILIFGNKAYAGQRLEGAFNMQAYLRAYAHATIGYRTRINEMIDLGGTVSYLNGGYDATANITDSYFETEQHGRYIKMGLNGSFRSSVDLFANNAEEQVLRNFINFQNTGVAASFGANFQLSESLQLTSTVKDLGGINWNENSIGYDLGKEIEFKGANTLSSEEVRDSVFENISSFAVDSFRGSYFSPLYSRIDVTLHKKFGDRLAATLVGSKPFYFPETDVALLADLRMTKKWHLLGNLVYNTSNYFALGAHLQFKGRWLEYYFGSEQLGNLIFHARGESQDVQNQVVPLGVDWHFGMALKFGRCRRPKAAPFRPKDSDFDGVLDALDKCPNTPGPADRNGCPYKDQDDDKVIDLIDDCVETPGVAEYNGCPVPDKDRDGLADDKDGCPDEFGPRGNNGCPYEDTDMDGVRDVFDKCPKIAGPASNDGCPYPDSDNDGIKDDKDNCPQTPGPVSNQGCPDVPREAELTKEEKEAVDEAFENLIFQTGSTKIDSYSIPSLAKLANVLRNRPEISLIIEGHTDNVGSEEGNKRLSQKRADAVKQFFIDKGISADRLTSIGYGEEKPIASNETAIGRSVNRRVEFKLLQ